MAEPHLSDLGKKVAGYLKNNDLSLEYIGNKSTISDDLDFLRMPPSWANHHEYFVVPKTPLKKYFLHNKLLIHMAESIDKFVLLKFLNSTYFDKVEEQLIFGKINFWERIGHVESKHRYLDLSNNDVDEPQIPTTYTDVLDKHTIHLIPFKEVANLALRDKLYVDRIQYDKLKSLNVKMPNKARYLWT